jgi:hypothetical protein
VPSSIAEPPSFSGTWSNAQPLPPLLLLLFASLLLLLLYDLVVIVLLLLLLLWLLPLLSSYVGTWRY